MAALIRFVTLSANSESRVVKCFMMRASEAPFRVRGRCGGAVNGRRADRGSAVRVEELGEVGRRVLGRHGRWSLQVRGQPPHMAVFWRSAPRWMSWDSPMTLLMPETAVAMRWAASFHSRDFCS